MDRRDATADVTAVPCPDCDGFRRGSYLVGASLLALPLVAFSPATEGGTFGGRVLLFLAGEALFGLGALVVAAVGYGATKGFDRLRT